MKCVMILLAFFTVPLFLLSLCVDGELVCAEGYTQVTGVMAMMMTGRVLLVCALCVLWCGGGGCAENDADVVSGGGPGTGKGDKNSEELRSSDLSSLGRQKEGAAGGRGSAGSQGLKDNVVPNTDRHAPNEEQGANLVVDPPNPTTDQNKSKDSTKAGAGTINQTAPPSAGPPPPPPPPVSEAEGVERTKTPEEQDSPVDHHSTQHRTVPQKKELEQQEQNTQGQIIKEQHESERIQVQQEKEKEEQRSEEQLEQREHLEEEIRDQQKKKKQEQQEEEHEEPQEEHEDSIKQGKEQDQQQQQQQHENAAENSEEPTKNETAVGTNATASTGDSSTAVSHTTSPLLLLLLVACAAAAAVVAA
ncbi:Mucin-associated surface protein (MASP) subgroup S015 [Trypanosoma cruzi]|uniref:Mucin-associated surface protein (MASP) subgroup S015 n=1 Tax=Trypanosoma cruzi TaxID=5693 RepID=A0A7J6XQ28_TRYCR|nr:Mucin-associated surface protein (MASP) subgroup S015 [Trypanosoma cruzi]